MSPCMSLKFYLEDPSAQLTQLLEPLVSLGELGSKEAEKVADAGRQGILSNFQREQSPAGKAWVPLAFATQRIRRTGIDERGIRFQTGAAHPILVRTQDLKLSFTEPRHPRNITLISHSHGGTGIELGAQDDPQTPGRIETLHSGGRTPSGRVVPPRPFVGLSDQAVTQVDKVVRWVLSERLTRVQEGRG